MQPVRVHDSACGAGEWLAAVGAAALLVLLFLTWFGLSTARDAAARRARAWSTRGWRARRRPRCPGDRCAAWLAVATPRRGPSPGRSRAGGRSTARSRIARVVAARAVARSSSQPGARRARRAALRRVARASLAALVLAVGGWLGDHGRAHRTRPRARTPPPDAAPGAARPPKLPPPMIDRAQVLHVARLARLDLSDEEVERMAGELSAVLGHIEKIGELDLAGVAADLPRRRRRERAAPRRAAAVACRARWRSRRRPTTADGASASRARRPA